MMTKKILILEGDILDENVTYTLADFCRICGVSEDDVIKMVNVGILEPYGETYSRWEFTFLQLQRFKKALHLKRDLNLGPSGIALSLELLEEIKQLQNRVQQLEQLLMLCGVNIPNK
jgi:chaperone modulatory protein CbpM